MLRIGVSMRYLSPMPSVLPEVRNQFSARWPSPVITQQPTTLYAARDTNAPHDSASGSPDLNYQWYQNRILLPDGNEPP